MRIQLIFLGLLLMFSCRQNGKKPLDPIAIQQKINDTVAKKYLDIHQGLVIDNFTNLPNKIEDCHCFFSDSPSDFKKRQYIYADNFRETAFMKMNGSFRKFKKIKMKKMSATYTMEKYVGDDLDLMIDIKQISQVDKTRRYEGLLKIVTKTGNIIGVHLLYSDCGC